MVVESRSSPARAWLMLSRTVVLAVIALFAGLALTGTVVPMPVQAAVYLVGMIALNLPHGGFEHVANLRMRRLGFVVRYVAAFLMLIVAFVALFLVAPLAGLTLALIVAMVKGGIGDVRAMAVTTGASHLGGLSQQVLAVLARGLPVMAIGMAVHTEAFWWFSELMVGLVDPDQGPAVHAWIHHTAPVAGALAALAIAAHLAGGLVRASAAGAGRARALRHWRADAFDTLLLTTFFIVVPVVVAVGLYFPFWYSSRQVARAVAIREEPEPEPGALFAGLERMEPGRIILIAWLTLVVGALLTVSVAVATWVVFPNAMVHSQWLFTGVAFWSVFISIIALPHILVGQLFDRKRGIWYVPRGAEMNSA